MTYEDEQYARFAALCRLLEAEGHMTPYATRYVLQRVTKDREHRVLIGEVGALIDGLRADG